MNDDDILDYIESNNIYFIVLQSIFEYQITQNYYATKSRYGY